MTAKELRQLVALLKKIKHPERGLPQGVFDALVNVIPYIACELVVVSPKRELLMTWRDDEYWKGWHFPGGLLRYRESFLHRIKYVARHELGVPVKRVQFLFHINYTSGERGHGVSFVWRCNLERTPKVGKFFRRMPPDIIPSHRRLWKQVHNSVIG